MTNRSPASKGRVLSIHTATRPPLGPDTGIQALLIRHLARETHEVHVACATGPANDPTKRLGVTDNVIFTGLRSDVPPLMAAADIRGRD